MNMLFQEQWYSGPKIVVTGFWEVGARTATSVQVRLAIDVSGLQYSDSYFGYTIVARAHIDGSDYGSDYMIKNHSPSQWFSTITEYYPSSSGWYTIPVSASRTSLTAGFTVHSDEGTSHTYSGTVTFPVGNTAPYWPSGSSCWLNMSGIIPENTASITVSSDGARDDEGNAIIYAADAYKNGVNTVDSPEISSPSYTFSIADLGQGGSFYGRMYCRDADTGWGTYLTSNTVTKNTFTKAQLQSIGAISFSTTVIAVTRSNATNTNGNSSITYSLSADKVTVYNGSLPATTTNLTIYRSGELPSGPYVKFDDLKTAFAGSSYAGTIVFTLTSHNAYGSSGTSTYSVSVDLKQPPVAFSINAPTGTYEIPTTAGSATPTKTYYVFNRKELGLSWGASSDPLNAGAITYTVQCSYNGGAWFTLLSTTATSCSVPISTSMTRTISFKYRVVASTVYGVTYTTDPSDAVTLHYYNPPKVSVVAMHREENNYTIQLSVTSDSSIYGTLLKDVFTLTRVSDSVVVDTFTRSGYGTSSYSTEVRTITGLSETTSYTLHIAFTDQVCTALGLTPAAYDYVIPRYAAMLTIREKGVGVNAVAGNGGNFIVKGSPIIDVTGEMNVSLPQDTSSIFIGLGRTSDGDLYAQEAISGSATCYQIAPCTQYLQGFKMRSVTVTGTFAKGQVVPEESVAYGNWYSPATSDLTASTFLFEQHLKTLGSLTVGGSATVAGSVSSTNGGISANGGYLQSTANGNTVTIGSQNTGLCHFNNSANIPFYFNKDILIGGNIYPYSTVPRSCGTSANPWTNTYTKALTLNGSVVNDFVVEYGCPYSIAWEKTKSGVLHCWLDSPVTLTGSTPTALMGGYYSYVEIEMPVSCTVGGWTGVASGRLGTGIGFAQATGQTATTVRVAILGSQNSNSIVLTGFDAYGKG